MAKFSFLSLLDQATKGSRSLERQWRSPDPRKQYDVVIVGAGGHGLATAYFLAVEHGIRNVAVVEKGWLGGGNTGRNTTIIRSNYLHPASARLYDHALKLWEGLSEKLNYNLMFSPRGVLRLAHDRHEMQSLRRHAHANRLLGIESEVLDPIECKRECPPLDISLMSRYPVVGATLQRRGGTARHDAVAWALARASDRAGVDVIEKCEVTDFIRGCDGAIQGIKTSRGDILTDRVALCAAGHTSVLAGKANVRLPLESYPLQALVSEPIKPLFPCVVMSSAIHAYVSQSDKGELVIGGGMDQYCSYSQRGGPQILTQTLSALCELFPQVSRLRMLRSWAGIVDVTPDRSPIISPTKVKGLFVNCGWGTGGFKATPGAGQLLAWMLAKGVPHPIAEPFGLNRFQSGELVDESAAAAVAH